MTRRRKIVVDYPPIRGEEGFRPLAADALDFTAGQAKGQAVEAVVEAVAGHGVAQVMAMFHTIEDAVEASRLLAKHFPQARVIVSEPDPEQEDEQC